MKESEEKPVRVFGALLVGYAQACVNLNIVAGRRGAELIGGLEVNRWYPLSRLRRLERLVLESYENTGAIMERVGMEMMFGWYHYGPGRDLVQSGADFLRFQSGSEGYASVIDGPDSLLGEFTLVSEDREAGRATLRSTTPLNRDMERGVLIGGMKAPGDLDFVDVAYMPERQAFSIEYH